MKTVNSFRQVRTQEDVAAWVAKLDNNNPERRDVIQHIREQIGSLPFAEPHVIELCPGSGGLAEALLTAFPQITYTGLDSSEPLLTYARNRLASFSDRAGLSQVDLNQDAWLGQVPAGIHAIVSMQSLHDLGGEAEVNRIYGLAHKLLAPDGLFLNADFVVPLGEDLVGNPGRRSIPRHFELLQSHGYSRVACTLEIGGFGCFVAFKDEA